MIQTWCYLLVNEQLRFLVVEANSSLSCEPSCDALKLGIEFVRVRGWWPPSVLDCLSLLSGIFVADAVVSRGGADILEVSGKTESSLGTAGDIKGVVTLFGFDVSMA